jgi:hypothetical protein
MKRINFFILFLLCLSVYNIFCQQRFSPDPNIKLPLDEKIKLYFDTFRDGFFRQGQSRFASYIVREFGDEVIPYLKEYIKDADFFHYKVEPKDLTLELIGYVWESLQGYANPVYKDVVKEYHLDENDIQWFVNQYKYKLDQYISRMKVIDETVISGETGITYVTGYTKNWENGKWVGGNETEKYGHPDFLGKDGRFKINEIKKYYEERLGIKIK